ncbi:MAG: hypothetical protein NXI24_08065 [bacterium]|nr:hypothetical protein [bacterium]
MSNKVEAGLAKFSESDLSVKLCNTMFGVLPFAPEYKFYTSIDEAASRMGASPEVAAKAKEIAATDDVGKAIWVAETLDTSDKLIAGFAGVKNLFSIFSGGPRKRTFEADQEQATDAALKGVGLAYMIYKLFPGDVTTKITNFKNLPAGQEAALFYVTGEVALPFADNVAEGGAGVIQKLMNSKQGDIASKFSGFAGADAIGQATEVMGQLTGTLDQYVGQAKEYTTPMMDKIKGILPAASTVANVADSATGAVASGIDLLPVWSLLGSRLAAEACVQQAMQQ